MSNSIEGKVVVITGASSGLGEATARLLSTQGASVCTGRTARRPPSGIGRHANRQWRQGDRADGGRDAL